MMNGKKIKDINGRVLTRYHLDLYDDNERYKDVKDVLDRCEGKMALIKDAVIKYVRSDSFDIEEYEGNRARKERME